MTFRGRVEKWIDDRGFGFIARDDGLGNVFAHVTSLADGIESLSCGQPIEFEIGTDSRSGRQCAKAALAG